jgi:hypothetical protein
MIINKQKGFFIVEIKKNLLGCINIYLYLCI